jgi:tetratricopeptide (TPR) repeat protein
MKRLPARGAWLPRGARGALAARVARTARAALASAAVVCAATLSGCAGTPEPAEPALSPEEISAALIEAQESLILSTPAGLEACARRMGLPGLPQPRAGELAALAGSLYRLLYPEIAVPPSFPPPGAYDGPYQPALASAERGAPPPASWAPPGRAVGVPEAQGKRSGKKGSAPAVEEVLAAEAALASYLDRVIPALFLARTAPLPRGEDLGAAEVRALEAGLTAAVEQAPRSVLPPYLLGRLSELSGRGSAASRLYRDSLTLSGSFYPARQRLAALALASGETAEAAAELELLRAQFPEDGGIRDTLIEVYLESATPAKAAPLVAEALMEEPDSREHLYQRAEILLREGSWSQALKPLALLLLNHPEAREGYLLMARIQYDHARDIERALEVLREAGAQFPADAEIPELAGKMLLGEGRSDEGLAELRRALELEPGRLSTLRLVVGEAMRLQRWVQASRSLEEILEQEQSVEDLANAFTVARRLGDRPLALSYAETLYRLEPGDASRLRYAGALLGAGRREEARGLVDQALEPSAPPEVRSSMLYLQAALLEQTDPEEALRTLQRALIADPDNDQAVRRLAELYLQRGELREARLFFRTAVQQNPGDAGLKLQLEQVEQALETSGGQTPPR